MLTASNADADRFTDAHCFADTDPNTHFGITETHSLGGKGKNHPPDEFVATAHGPRRGIGLCRFHRLLQPL